MPQTRTRARSGAAAEEVPAEKEAVPETVVVKEEETVDEDELLKEEPAAENPDTEELADETKEDTVEAETTDNEEQLLKEDTQQGDNEVAVKSEKSESNNDSEAVAGNGEAETEAEAEAEAEMEDEDGKEKSPKPQIELDEKAKTYVVVVVGYVTYADFGLTELKLPLLKCNSFETRFFQDEDAKKGYVTMFFSKSWDAYVALDKLRDLEVPRGSDTTNNYSCWLMDRKTAHNVMRQETATLRQLRTQLNSINDQDPSLRSLFVANIPKSATKELLTAIFAEAQDIVLPLAEPGKNKGYCYIEFSDADKLDEYLTKYQDIKIEDGEVSAKIIIRKLGNTVNDKSKDRASRLLKARSKQQISDLGKKTSLDNRNKKVRRSSSGPPNRSNSYNRNDRYNRQYRPRQYGFQNYGRGGPRDPGERRDQGAAALAAIQQLLAKPMMRGGGRGGNGGNFRRGPKRRFPSGPFDDFGGGDYGMPPPKAPRRYDPPMDYSAMEGPSGHFYEDNYEGWGGANSFAQTGYGGGGGLGGGYMGGGGGGGYSGGNGGMDVRRRKNFRKFNKQRN